MSPPIDIDGSEIQRATIDGEDVSEITIDGQQTAGFVNIPDSAIHQWRFDEGSLSTVADSIGSNDGIISGASWESKNDAEGGQRLSFDGADDEVDYSTVSEISESATFSVAITVNIGSLSGQQSIWVHALSSGDRFTIAYEDTRFEAGVLDGNNWYGRVLDSGQTTDRFRLGVSVDGPNDTVKIYKNGSQSGDGDTTSISESLTSAGHKMGDGGGNAYGGTLDHPIVYNEILDSAEFSDDYNAQPWS